MAKIHIQKVDKLLGGIIPLLGSKSESNRALIINSLCQLPGEIDNLALARDTEIMLGLLRKDHLVYDVQDAGTVMRFMTAYLSVKKINAKITGSDRMKKRPIGILVDALRAIGVEISYLEESGYPPLEISGFLNQISDKLQIDSNVSSQYISALLMIAPKLPRGLSLELTGEPVSTPYIDMTLSIMQHFGVKVDVNGRQYRVLPQSYNFASFRVESDWSGASYWYSIFALSGLSELVLQGLKANSYQGDSVVAKMMLKFGVKTIYQDGNAILTKVEPSLPEELDFINCPDLAQTFAVLCAAFGHRCRFLGLQTLKIKETDRVVALKTELRKVGADFIEHNDFWEVIPPADTNFSSIKEVEINTYEDHRMAMAFTALAFKLNILFDDAEVVNKSYPTFWRDLATFGLEIE